MSKTEVVNAWQMALLYLAYASGSAIINLPGPLTGFSKNGAWLSLLIAGGASLLLLLCLLYMHRIYPGLTYIEYSRKALGKWLSIPVSILFLIMAMLLVSYIVVDIGGFFTTTLMKTTPNYVFHSLILLTAALTARAGLEVMARMFCLLQIGMFITIVSILLIVSPYYRPELLIPLLPPDGMKPVLHGAYYTFGFPFAEVVLFGMLLPFVNKETGKSLGKLMVLTLLFNVVILILVVDCTMMAVGPLSGELKYSLYELARLISVGDFIERIESVIGLSLTIGSYMKATIVLYVLNLALANTLKIKDMRIFTLPLALVSFFLTLVMFDNESEFVERVTVVWPLMNIVCTVIPLLTITLVTIMRGMFSNQANKAAPKP